MSSARRPILALLAVSAAVARLSGWRRRTRRSGDRVAVSVSESGCSPSTVTVPSGPVTFVVTNAGTETGEFEIVLADTRVIDEVENIVPGLRREHVDPGRWRHLPDDLRQHPGAQGRAHGHRRRRAVAAAERGRRPGEARRRARRLRHLRQRAGDRPGREDRRVHRRGRGRRPRAGRRRSTRRPACRGSGSSPSPSSSRDLDPTIDFREEDFDGGVDDPGFKGFHKIEKVLFKDGTTDGLAPLAAELRRQRRRAQEAASTTLVIEPRVMARGAGELIEEVAQSKMTGEEDRYSKRGPRLDRRQRRRIRPDRRRPPADPHRRSTPRTWPELDAAGKAVEDGHRQVRDDGRRLPAVRRDHRRTTSSSSRPVWPTCPSSLAELPGPPRAGGVDRPMPSAAEPLPRAPS